MSSKFRFKVLIDIFEEYIIKVPEDCKYGTTQIVKNQKI